MKKIAAILFLNLLLFNWFGYKLVFNYLQQKAELQLEARIDLDDYDESQLIEIRMDLQLPYQNTWEKFERCYGNIEIDGKYYTYVKRKMVDGYMILKCLPNASKEIIKSAENMLIKASQGFGLDHEKTTSLFAKTIKCYIGDFENNKATSALNGLNTLDHTFWPPLIACVESGFVTSSEQPPDWCISHPSTSRFIGTCSKGEYTLRL